MLARRAIGETVGAPFLAGDDPRRQLSPDAAARRVGSYVANRRAHYGSLPWDDTPDAEKRRRIFNEQARACLCGVSEWRGAQLTMELHHLDGDHANTARDNLSLLCPNCHSQTYGFRDPTKRRNTE